MNYRLYTNTEKSWDPRHQVNEDRSLFTEIQFMKDQKIRILLIADGMGGLKNGDRAADQAIRGFMNSFYCDLMNLYMESTMEDYSVTYSVEAIRKAMIRGICQANTAVCETADVFTDTGATLSAVCIVGDCLVVANVGDSPVYLYRRKKREMRRISELQTKAELDVSQGSYERYSADYYKNEHILTGSLGEYTELTEDRVYSRAIGHISPGDVILTGSDGCFGHMQENLLAEMIEECPREEEGFILTQLFDMARIEKNDDQTAILYIVGENEEDYE